MARMSIDDQALRDSRVLRLAKAMDWSRRETLGCLLDVWALCYDRASPILAAHDIDIAAGVEGFHREMALAELAQVDGQAVRVAGAEKRVLYLVDVEERGRAGGQRSGEVRRDAVTGKTKTKRGANLPDRVPVLVPPSDGVPVPPSDGDRVPIPEGEKRRRAARAPEGQEPAERWQDVIDAFNTAYLNTNHRKPSWSSPEARRAMKALNAIVREHGADEVIRRIDLVHATPPNWPPGPWTAAMFVQHFDRLVGQERVRRQVSPQQQQLDAQTERIRDMEQRAARPHDYEGKREWCELCGKERDHWLHVGEVEEEKMPWE